MELVLEILNLRLGLGESQAETAKLWPKLRLFASLTTPQQDCLSSRN